VKSDFEVRNESRPFEINFSFTIKNQLQVTLKFLVDPYLHLQHLVLMPTAAVSWFYFTLSCRQLQR
jgi:hypothetical protein